MLYEVVIETFAQIDRGIDKRQSHTVALCKTKSMQNSLSRKHFFYNYVDDLKKS